MKLSEFMGKLVIEVFFKSCTSYLHLSKECNSLSYDVITAHVAVVFTRSMMSSIKNRESLDERSLGELFLYFSDELVDSFMNSTPTTLISQLQAA